MLFILGNENLPSCLNCFCFLKKGMKYKEQFKDSNLKDTAKDNFMKVFVFFSVLYFPTRHRIKVNNKKKFVLLQQW